MRYQKKEKGSKNVNLTIHAGQSKVFLEDLLKNEPPPSAIDANTNHTVVGGFSCIDYQLYRQTDKIF